MATREITCPFCNTPMSVTEEHPAGQRLNCTRCGESFPLRGEAAEANGAVTAVRPITRVSVAPDARPANRTIARIVLGIMLSMGMLGLVYALWTVAFRRGNDPQPIFGVTPAVAPAKLAAVGYLPDDTQLVAGLHVAELQQTPLGRDFLDRYRLGPVGIGIADIESSTGLKRQDIDHVVFAMNLQGKQLLRFLLMIQTRMPIDEAALHKQMQSEKKTELDGKTVHTVTMDNPPLKASLWLPQDKTVVLAMNPNDLRAMPAAPKADGDRPATSLWTLVKEIGPGSQAWMVGHSQQGERTPLRLAIGEGGNFFRTVQTFGIWWQVDRGLRQYGSFQCADAASAAELKAGLAKGPETLALFNGMALGPNGKELSQDLLQNLTIDQDQEWVRLQGKASEEKLKKALKK